MLGREDVDLADLLQHLAGQRVDLADALHVLAEQLDTVGSLAIGRLHFQCVAAHPEPAALQDLVVALVVDVHQLAQQLVAAHLVAQPQMHHLAAVILGAAQSVDRRHRRDDHHIAAAEQRRGSRQPQPVDLLVDTGVLLDVGVGARDVGFRLVIVVVADEVLDRVAGEELAELSIELRRQRLVVRHNQRGTL